MAVNKVIFNTASGEQTLVDLTGTTAHEDAVFDGAIFHGADGEEKIGKFTIVKELSDQTELIRRIEAGLQGKTSGGGATPTQEKTVDITENGTVEVVPDEGYALSKVTANVKVESSGGDPVLPSGYARADYIQFTGEQTVDTGIICNQDTTIKVVFTREKSASHYLCGVASSDNTASVTAYFGGNWRFGNKASSKNPTTNADMIYSGILSSSQITTTSSKTAISGVNEFETVGSMLLGSCRSASGAVASSQFNGKIFVWLMWSGDELVQKLIPVVDSDGVYRFYDVVSKAFFDSITDVPLDGGNL